jgi:hypothetical protein
VQHKTLRPHLSLTVRHGLPGGARSSGYMVLNERVPVAHLPDVTFTPRKRSNDHGTNEFHIRSPPKPVPSPTSRV